MLPFFALSMFGNLASQLIAQAFILPFQLLPIAIKYAPLALLFLEAPSGKEVFYVELTQPHTTFKRIDNFTDEKGKNISVLFAASDDLNLQKIRQEFSRNQINAVVVLGADDMQNLQLPELEEIWKLMSSRPASIWIAGKPAEKMRSERLTLYI